MLERGRRQRWHERRAARPEHPFGRQLPGFAAKETLAERQVALRQEHHGPGSAPLLSKAQTGAYIEASIYHRAFLSSVNKVLKA